MTSRCTSRSADFSIRRIMGADMQTWILFWLNIATIVALVGLFWFLSKTIDALGEWVEALSSRVDNLQEMIQSQQQLLSQTSDTVIKLVKALVRSKSNG